MGSQRGSKTGMGNPALPAFSNFTYDEPRFSIRTLQHGTGMGMKTGGGWRFNGDMGGFAMEKFKNHRPKVDPELLEEAFEAFHNYDTRGPRTPEGDVNPNLPVPIKIDNVYLMIESLGFGFTRREIYNFLEEFGNWTDIDGEQGVLLSKNDVDRFLSNTHSNIAAEWSSEARCKNPWNAVDRFTNALRSLHSSVGTDVELEHLEHFCCTLGDELTRDEWDEMMRHLRDDKSRTKPKPLDMIVFADRVEQELRKSDVGPNHKAALEKQLTERLEEESETSSVEDEEEQKEQKERKPSKEVAKAPKKAESKDDRREESRDRDRDRDRDRSRPDSRSHDKETKEEKSAEKHKKRSSKEKAPEEKEAKASKDAKEKKEKKDKEKPDATPPPSEHEHKHKHKPSGFEEKKEESAPAEAAAPAAPKAAETSAPAASSGPAKEAEAPAAGASTPKAAASNPGTPKAGATPRSSGAKQ